MRGIVQRNCAGGTLQRENLFVDFISRKSVQSGTFSKLNSVESCCSGRKYPERAVSYKTALKSGLLQGRFSRASTQIK